MNDFPNMIDDDFITFTAISSIEVIKVSIRFEKLYNQHKKRLKAHSENRTGTVPNYLNNYICNTDGVTNINKNTSR